MSMVKHNIWEEKNLTVLNPNLSLNVENVKCDTTNELKKSSNEKPENGIKETSGIYKIVNKVDGKYYVGRSKNINCGCNSRWRCHINQLNRNSHNNVHLQYAWNKYGSENFDFLISEEVGSENIKEVEQRYLDIAKLEQLKCYNLDFSSDGPSDPSEFVRQKMSNSHIKLWDDERRKKKSESSKRLWNTEKYRLTHKTAMKPVTDSQEFRAKVSELSTKMWLSQEFRNKMSVVKKNLYNNNKLIRHNLVRFGKRNGRYDKSIYYFFNNITSETFSGTQFDFTIKFNLRRQSVNNLINNRIKSTFGWIVVKK